MALPLYTKRKIKRINVCEFPEALPCKILILPPMQCPAVLLQNATHGDTITEVFLYGRLIKQFIDSVKER